MAALISSGQILSAIEVLNKATNVLVPLTAGHYQYDSLSRTVRIDLTADGNGGSHLTVLPDGRFQLQLDTALIAAAADAGNHLVDGDGTSDGLHRYDFHQLLGDFDGDRIVGGVDMGLFASNYRRRTGDPGFNATYDLDRNGVIDASDLLTLRRRFGTRLPVG